MSTPESNTTIPVAADATPIASEAQSRPNSHANSRPNWANWALLIGLLGVLAYMQWRGSFSPMPPVFSEGLTLDQGAARAENQGRLVLAYASASWCGPCQTYKRTTLVDDDVVAWIRRHAEPVYINIDRQQTEARQLAISSIPVTILLRDGQEIARLTGAASAEEFMEWVKPWTPAAQQ